MNPNTPTNPDDADVGHNAPTRKRVEAMLAQGCGNAEVAAALGVKVDRLREWRKKWGIPTHMSPLDNPLAQEGAQARVEAMLEQGMADEDVADAFGVKVRTLRFWKKKWGLTQPRVMTQPDVRQRLETLLSEGKTDEEIAAAFGVVEQTVQAWKRRWELNPTPEELPPLLTCDVLANLKKEGATDREIAQAMAVSPGVIQRRRIACGLVSPHPSGKPGTRKRLEKLLAQGKTYAQCADALEVSESTIYNWARRWGLQPRAGRSA